MQKPVQNPPRTCTPPGLEELREAAAAPRSVLQRQHPPSVDWKKPDALGRVRGFAPEQGSYPTVVMIPGEGTVSGRTLSCFCFVMGVVLFPDVWFLHGSFLTRALHPGESQGRWIFVGH